jgi:hypothetical protein
MTTAGAPSQRPRQETPSTWTLEPEPAIFGTPQVARLVAADADVYIGRRPKSEMREEADDLVEPVQWHIEPGRELLNLLLGQVPELLLDRAQRWNEHQTYST